MNKLRKLENRAARIATKTIYDVPFQPILEKLGWQTIRELSNRESATMVYQSINNEAPKFLSSLFDRLSQNAIRELPNTETYSKLPLLEISNVLL